MVQTSKQNKNLHWSWLIPCDRWCPGGKCLWNVCLWLLTFSRDTGSGDHFSCLSSFCWEQQWVTHIQLCLGCRWNELFDTPWSVSAFKLPPRLTERTLTDYDGHISFWKSAAAILVPQRSKQGNWWLLKRRQGVRIHRCSIKPRTDNVDSPALREEVLWFSFM